LSSNVATVTATYGLQSGVHCRQVDSRAIGNKSVLEAGFIDAVDLWGYVEQGVEICFPQAGVLILLDASTAPRSVVPLEAYASNGNTCAALNVPGTVVLAPGQSPPRQEPVAAPAQPEQQPVAAEQPVVVTEATVDTVAPETGQCLITTTGHLRHRAAPEMGDNIIGYVVRGTTLARLSSVLYWVQVEYRGQVGWIIDSPRYLVYSGACG
jgi:hypothetical protein